MPSNSSVYLIPAKLLTAVNAHQQLDFRVDKGIGYLSLGQNRQNREAVSNLLAHLKRFLLLALCHSLHCQD